MRASSPLLSGAGVALLAFLLLATVLAVAAKEYVAPRAYHAKTYPARDEHPQENVTIAADPYDMPDKAAIFTLPYKERGLLPVYLIITNDGDQPISLSDMKVQLVTARKDKLFPADSDDLRRRFSRLKRRPGEPDTRSPLPIPLPRRTPQGTISREGLDEIQNAMFQARAVEPKSTQAGFLFFDVSDLEHPLAGAHLYVTGVRDADAHELMYFEIAMEKYLTYRPGQAR